MSNDPMANAIAFMIWGIIIMIFSAIIKSKVKKGVEAELKKIAAGGVFHRVSVKDARGREKVVVSDIGLEEGKRHLKTVAACFTVDDLFFVVENSMDVQVSLEGKDYCSFRVVTQ